MDSKSVLYLTIFFGTITLLNIELEHLKINATLPFHHRDPFERIIIAQSMAENIPIITIDSVFNKYSIILI
jgi:PIN domain nuclease of toxin-antitoxin system